MTRHSRSTAAVSVTHHPASFTMHRQPFRPVRQVPRLKEPGRVIQMTADVFLFSRAKESPGKVITTATFSLPESLSYQSPRKARVNFDISMTPRARQSSRDPHWATSKAPPVAQTINTASLTLPRHSISLSPTHCTTPAFYCHCQALKDG